MEPGFRGVRQPQPGRNPTPSFSLSPPASHALEQGHTRTPTQRPPPCLQACEVPQPLGMQGRPRARCGRGSGFPGTDDFTLWPGSLGWYQQMQETTGPAPCLSRLWVPMLSEFCGWSHRRPGGCRPSRGTTLPCLVPGEGRISVLATLFATCFCLPRAAMFVVCRRVCCRVKNRWPCVVTWAHHDKVPTPAVGLRGKVPCCSRCK